MKKICCLIMIVLCFACFISCEEKSNEAPVTFIGGLKTPDMLAKHFDRIFALPEDPEYNDTTKTLPEMRVKMGEYTFPLLVQQNYLGALRTLPRNTIESGVTPEKDSALFTKVVGAAAASNYQSGSFDVYIAQGDNSVEGEKIFYGRFVFHDLTFEPTGPMASYLDGTLEFLIDEDMTYRGVKYKSISLTTVRDLTYIKNGETQKIGPFSSGFVGFSAEPGTAEALAAFSFNNDYQVAHTLKQQ